MVHHPAAVVAMPQGPLLVANEMVGQQWAVHSSLPTMAGTAREPPQILTATCTPTIAHHPAQTERLIKNMVMHQLFPLVRASHPELSGEVRSMIREMVDDELHGLLDPDALTRKICGMFHENKSSEICCLIESSEQRSAKISAAICALEEHVARKFGEVHDEAAASTASTQQHAVYSRGVLVEFHLLNAEVRGDELSLSHTCNEHRTNRYALLYWRRRAGHALVQCRCAKAISSGDWVSEERFYGGST